MFTLKVLEILLIERIRTRTASSKEQNGEKPKKCLALAEITRKVIALQAQKVLNGF